MNGMGRGAIVLIKSEKKLKVSVLLWYAVEKQTDRVAHSPVIQPYKPYKPYTPYKPSCVQAPQNGRSSPCALSRTMQDDPHQERLRP